MNKSKTREIELNKKLLRVEKKLELIQKNSSSIKASIDRGANNLKKSGEKQVNVSQESRESKEESRDRLSNPSSNVLKKSE